MTVAIVGHSRNSEGKQLPEYDASVSSEPAPEPDWRHRRARDLLRNGEALQPKTDGPLTRLYAEQLMRLRAGLPLVANSYGQAILTAMRWQRNKVLRTRIHARILSGVRAEEIGRMECVDPRDVRCFAGLYFDVPGRLQFKDYMYAKVIKFADRSRENLLSTGFLITLAGYELGGRAVNLLLDSRAADVGEVRSTELFVMQQSLLLHSLKIRVGAARPDQLRTRQWIRQYRQLEKRYRQLEQTEQQLAALLATLKTPVLEVDTMTTLVDECERRAA